MVTVDIKTFSYISSVDVNVRMSDLVLVLVKYAYAKHTILQNLKSFFRYRSMANHLHIMLSLFYSFFHRYNTHCYVQLFILS